MIDNSSCKTAIQNMKSAITQCFDACRSKNSTYTPTKETLANSELLNAINGIPSGSGGGTESVNMNAQPCTHLNVTWAEITDPSDIPQQFTIDFSSIGVTFKALVIYSATNDGYFAITRIDSTKCVISAHPFIKYNNESITGVTDLGEGTYRANYVVNGNSITFTRANYENDGVNFAGSKNDNFRSLPMQIAPVQQDPILTQEDYLLELINVIV